MSKSYKLILFDYGGVIVQYPNVDQFETISQMIDVPRADIIAEYWKHNHLTNVQNLPWIEACLAAVKQFDNSAETEEKVRAMNNFYLSGQQLNQELLTKVAELKSSGYAIAILSNYTSELRNELVKLKLDELFEHVFVSGELGYQKPMPEAFQAVFDAMDVQAEEVVFIDDTPRSLQTAELIGYTPILYKDNEQLFGEFERLGVL